MRVPRGTHAQHHVWREGNGLPRLARIPAGDVDAPVLAVDFEGGATDPLAHVREVRNRHLRELHPRGRRTHPLEQTVEVLEGALLGGQNRGFGETAAIEADGERLRGRVEPAHPGHHARADDHRAALAVLVVRRANHIDVAMHHRHVGGVLTQPGLDRRADVDEETECWRGEAVKVVILHLRERKGRERPCRGR